MKRKTDKILNHIEKYTLSLISERLSRRELLFVPKYIKTVICVTVV